MSDEINQQAKNITHLLELVAQNPELPIVPIVNTECVGSEDFASWIASWGNPRIDYIWKDGERFYIKSEDFEELVDIQIARYNTDEEKTKKLVEAYSWEKVIVVEIEPL